MQMETSIGARPDRLSLSAFLWRLPGPITAGRYPNSFGIAFALPNSK